MRRAVLIRLTEDERNALQKWSDAEAGDDRLAERARIVLLAAAGKSNEEIADAVGLGRVAVGRWRKRFAEHRLAGIEKDAPRSGRPAKSQELAARIVQMTTQSPPPTGSAWSVRTLADAVGASRAMVHRVWRANQIAPHLVRQNAPQDVYV